MHRASCVWRRPAAPSFGAQSHRPVAALRRRLRRRSRGEYTVSLRFTVVPIVLARCGCNPMHPRILQPLAPRLQPYAPLPGAAAELEPVTVCISGAAAQLEPATAAHARGLPLPTRRPRRPARHRSFHRGGATHRGCNRMPHRLQPHVLQAAPLEAAPLEAAPSTCPAMAEGDARGMPWPTRDQPVTVCISACNRMCLRLSSPRHCCAHASRRV